MYKDRSAVIIAQQRIFAHLRDEQLRVTMNGYEREDAVSIGLKAI
jgi:hypothetical protein